MRGSLRRLGFRARFCARRARSQPANGPGKVLPASSPREPVRFPSCSQGSELRDALIEQVSFQGVTGLVDFYDGSSHPDYLYHGDRRVGVQYVLRNYQSNAAALVDVGVWSPCSAATGSNCSFASRWAAATDSTLVYSTLYNSSNSKPADVPPPACSSEHFNYTVSACDASSRSRRVGFFWLLPKTCEGGISLPANSTALGCDYVPVSSDVGIAIVTIGTIGAFLTLIPIVWLVTRRTSAVVKNTQVALSFVFVMGAMLSDLSNVSRVGSHSDEMCMLRPWVQNLPATLMFAALFQKVRRAAGEYRVYARSSSPRSRLSFHHSTPRVRLTALRAATTGEQHLAYLRQPKNGDAASLARGGHQPRRRHGHGRRGHPIALEPHSGGARSPKDQPPAARRLKPPLAACHMLAPLHPAHPL